MSPHYPRTRSLAPPVLMISSRHEQINSNGEKTMTASDLLFGLVVVLAIVLAITRGKTG